MRRGPDFAHPLLQAIEELFVLILLTVLPVDNGPLSVGKSVREFSDGSFLTTDRISTSCSVGYKCNSRLHNYCTHHADTAFVIGAPPPRPARV
jgi:hypothetical protein